jgi:hypothetical protein
LHQIALPVIYRICNAESLQGSRAGGRPPGSGIFNDHTGSMIESVPLSALAN